MADSPLREGSLVLYKTRAARVTAIKGKKIEIEQEGGNTYSVLPKHVTLLHPGPLRSLRDLKPRTGEVKVAWELLAGERTTLGELAELAYGDSTPQSAWAAWQLVEDGLYFTGNPEQIVARDPEFVAAEQAARASKAAEERAWSAFLGRVGEQRFSAEDERFLEEVVALALGQRDNSRLLRALGRSESPENAHVLLMEIGYWSPQVNPYPQRVGASLAAPAVPLRSLPDEPRRDLTHLTALAIDDEGNTDPDDAISIEGGCLWVHIADAAALVPPDSAADLEARARGATLYLPERTIPMLPHEVTERLGLGLDEVSPALSFALEVAENGEIRIGEIVPSWVRVTRLSYQEAEGKLEQPPLQAIHRLTQQFEARRAANGAIALNFPEVRVRVEEGRVSIRPLPSLRSRDLVRDAMLMTGEAVARFAQAHEIPLPYTSQEVVRGEIEVATTLAEMFELRRALRPSQQKLVPAPHAGLGLPLYAQATSPLRRYLDLVVHQQLRAFQRGEPLLDSQAITARIGAANAVTGTIRRAERLSNEHWTLVYLLQHPEWEGEGIVVDKRGPRDHLLLPELALENNIYHQQELPLDSRVTLSVGEVNLATLEVYFRVLG